MKCQNCNINYDLKIGENSKINPYYIYIGKLDDIKTKVYFGGTETSINYSYVNNRFEYFICDKCVEKSKKKVFIEIGIIFLIGIITFALFFILDEYSELFGYLFIIGLFTVGFAVKEFIVIAFNEEYGDVLAGQIFFKQNPELNKKYKGKIAIFTRKEMNKLDKY
jgi:hypothetical protein